MSTGSIERDVNRKIQRSYFDVLWSATKEIGYIYIASKLIHKSAIAIFSHNPETLKEKLRSNVLAPILEEICFRGVLQGIVIKNIQHYSYKWLRGREATSEELQSQKTCRVWLTALIFGAVHASNDHSNIYAKIFQVFSATIGGVIYGNSKEATGSCAPGIIFHAYDNLSVDYNDRLTGLFMYIPQRVTFYQIIKMIERFKARNINNPEAQTTAPESSRFRWLKSAMTELCFIGIATQTAHVLATALFSKVIENVEDMELVYVSLAYLPLIEESVHSVLQKGVGSLQHHLFKWKRGRDATESELNFQRIFRIFALAAIRVGFITYVAQRNTRQKLPVVFRHMAWGVFSGAVREATGSSAPSILAHAFFKVKLLLA